MAWPTGIGGRALPGDLIGQHLFNSIEFWSGQGCELFNACLGSVPWHQCPQGCSHSFREDLYLVLVTFLGTLPPCEICKRYCPFLLAGFSWEVLVLLCFSRTWSVCEEGRDWVWFVASSFNRSCLWADKGREHPQTPGPVQNLLQTVEPGQGRSEGMGMEKAMWGDGCALSDRRIKARREWGDVPSVQPGLPPGAQNGYVCGWYRSGSAIECEGTRWAPESLVSACSQGKGN